MELAPLHCTSAAQRPGPKLNAQSTEDQNGGPDQAGI